MKVAIYCRLSEEDKNKQFKTDDSKSIQNQKSMLLQYAIENNWEVYNIYSDDNYTGADRKRPEFNHLLEDAKQHKFDIILCKSQSRFTRELELVEKYINGLFPIWGIRFISIVDNADTANKSNKKSRQINGLINEWYLEDMSENIKSVLISKRQKGVHIGSFALYGYKKDPEQKGHLIVDEEAATIVREVFTLFSQGYGKTAIACMLNDRNIPNPTEYKRLHGLRYQQPKMKNSTLWKYFTIANMLTNEIYTGNMVQGKYGSISYKTKQNKPIPKEQWYVVKGTHEPIIDQELWDKVQALIKQHAKPFTNGTIGLFACKVKCVNCGYIMCSSKSRGKHYLKCSNRHISKDACIGSFISVDKLEQAVLSELKQLSQQYINKDNMEHNIKIYNNFEQQKANLNNKLEEYEKKLNTYKKALTELYLDKINNVITKDDYINLSKDFNVEKDKIEKLIDNTKNEILIIKKKSLDNHNRQKIIEQYINLEKLNREAVEELIDFIYIGKREKGSKENPIEIHWKF